MADPQLLEQLRQLRAIERDYIDFRGERRHVGDESLGRILAAMGHDVDDDEALRDDLQRLAERGWRRVLPPVLVLRPSRSVQARFTVLRPLLERLDWRVALEDGGERSGTLDLGALPVLDERHIGGLCYCRLAFELPGDLPLGYHELELTVPGGHRLDACRLIVVPERCYEPPPVAAGERLWGLAIQLYGLRSDRNWGVGDFTDLRELMPVAAARGIDVVGLNPLHALFPADPGLHSPYSPASRDFLNTIYIDPEVIPEYASSGAAQALAQSGAFQARLEALRATRLVDYAGVGACKDEVLRLVHATFEAEATAGRRKDFDEFINSRGQSIDNIALFYALQAHFTAAGRPGGWQAWPPEYQDPGGAAALDFRDRHRDAIRYHQFLQWIAAEQLGAAEAAARAAGMRVGIYRDLAVGVNGGGAEAWSDQDLYVQGASVGAPPDPLALSGQDWGIPPMHPDVLRERGYQPFIDLLNANMGDGGALRIDHVMVLHRLWWVPGGLPSSAGAYVYYDLEDLMGILALESQRHRCTVIGEDLGTVPEAIQRAMPDYGVYSYRVFFFVFEPDGRCLHPGHYPRHALVTASTHDLPTLASFWSGSDIDLRATLGLYPDAESEAGARAGRVRDRHRILAALAEEGLLPPEIAAAPASAAKMTPALCGAIQTYLARSNAALLVVQPEDWLGMEDAINVPGTSDEHANWRLKLTGDLAKLCRRPEIAELADRLGRERRRAG
jgi:4-alpha-glucanotransferase